VPVQFPEAEQPSCAEQAADVVNDAHVSVGTPVHVVPHVQPAIAWQDAIVDP